MIYITFIRFLTHVLFLFLVMLLDIRSVASQERSNPNGRSNNLSAGINFPMGDFSETHRLGIGIDYSFTNHHFGSMDVKPRRPLAFILNAGADHYQGKKETIGGNQFKYPSYTYLHVFGGAFYQTGHKTNLALSIGPSVGLYSGNIQMGFGVNLDASYYLKKNIAITPLIRLMKISRADPLWIGAVRASFCF